MSGLLPGSRRPAPGSRVLTTTAALGAAAYVVLLLPRHGMHHHGSQSVGVAGVLMWLAMLAMMAPWLRRNVRFVALRSPRRRRPWVAPEVLLGWAAVWVLALVPVALVSELLVRMLGQPGAALVGVAVASAWQLTPAKRRALARCDLTAAPPLEPRAARRTCVELGTRLGVACVVSDAALMLAMGTTGHHPVAVVGLLAVSWVERFRLPHHDRRAVATGLSVAACGAAVGLLALASG